MGVVVTELRTQVSTPLDAASRVQAIDLAAERHPHDLHVAVAIQIGDVGRILARQPRPLPNYRSIGSQGIDRVVGIIAAVIVDGLDDLNVTVAVDVGQDGSALDALSLVS